jgi:WD40 repeat protein
VLHLRNVRTHVEQLIELRGLHLRAFHLFSPDGRFVVTSYLGKQLAVWYLANHELRMRLATTDDEEDWLGPIRFSPDGRYLTGLSHKGWVWTWDLDTGERTETFRPFDRRPYAEVRISPDLQRMVTRRSNPHKGTSSHWGFHWRQLWTLTPGNYAPIADGPEFMGVHDVQLTAGRAFALGHQPVPTMDPLTTNVLLRGERNLRVWDLDNRRLLADIPDAGRGLISPDGRMIAVMPINGRPIELWSLPVDDPSATNLVVIAAAGMCGGLIGWWFCSQTSAHRLQ